MWGSNDGWCMSGCSSRIAWSAAVALVSVCTLSAPCRAQEVVADSYLVTYRASQVRAMGAMAARRAEVLGQSVQERTLGAGAGEVTAIRQESAGRMASVSSTEYFGRKQIDFCNALVSERSDVASCSPNWVVRASVAPNDSQYQTLWGMSGTNGIAAPQAWDITTGSDDVVVAIIDTGIDYTHPDLAANVWTNPNEIPGNGIDDDGDGVIDDVHGANFSGNGRPAGDPFDDNSHGTHVAGTIAASGNNGLGVVGVNWRAKILALKFLGANGSGATSGAIQALNYLITLKNRGVNVRIVNNSWGGGGDSAALRDAIERANSAGLLLTVAAGNSGQNIEDVPQYPAAYTTANLIKVAAIDRDGNLAYFSNYGGRLVDIAAPGVNILSTVPGNQYASYSGTSMATPHVSGVAALYLSNHPSASLAELKAAVIGGGRDLGSVVGMVASGRTLDAARTVSGQSAPIDAPTAECPYAISPSEDAVDTAADRNKPVITTDEDGFYKVTLPFSFPFEGTFRTSMVVSPNGVVYFGGAPANWDNRNQTVAPLNAIAALHTDLFPDPSVGGGLGVRVALSDSKVTVAWRARVYNRQTENEQAIVRLTLYPTGLINLSYSVGTAELESALASATIGVKGISSASSSTYAGAVHNGLRLQLTPGCQPQESVGTKVRSISAVAVVNNKARATVRAGSRILLRGSVIGSGAVQLVGRIDGKRCQAVSTLIVAERRIKRFGRIPAGISAQRVTLTLIGDDGRARTAALRLQHQRQSAKRANSVRNSCEELMKSFD